MKKNELDFLISTQFYIRAKLFQYNHNRLYYRELDLLPIAFIVEILGSMIGHAK